MAAKKALNIPATVERAQRDALDREYREYSRWLVSIARHRLGSSDDAEDMVQEAYIRAARYPAASRTRPRSLLSRILRNLIKDRARGRAREQAGGEALSRNVAFATVADADQHDLVFLKQVIIGMPDTYREVFLLSRFTAASQTEIAARLGISVKTVEWRLARALAYCAEQVAE